MSRVAAGLAVLWFLAPICSASAADFTGVWKGSAEFPGGQVMELTYDLKMQGDKIVGTIESPRGKIEMSDGKVSGDQFTFNTKPRRCECGPRGKMVGRQNQNQRAHCRRRS